MPTLSFRSLPTWRRVALASWRAADDPTIYGWLDVDATNLLDFVRRARDETRLAVTLTHVVGKAAATALAEVPDCNAAVTRRGLMRRDGVDVFFSVALGDGKNLAGAKLENVQRMNVSQIAQELSQRVDDIRVKKDSPIQRSQSVLRRIPQRALRRVMHASTSLSFDYGLNLEGVGIVRDPFGSVVVTNVGVLGVEQGFAPLIPAGRTAAVLTLGEVRDKVIAVNGEPVVRPVLTIGGTFDHRVVDGAHLGKISAILRRVLSDPARQFDTDPKGGMAPSRTQSQMRVS